MRLIYCLLVVCGSACHGFRGMELAAATVPAPAAEKKKDKAIPLFNGKDLTGWILRKGKVSLDGKTATPRKRFQVMDGKLVIDGKSRGNVVIETNRNFSGDVHLSFEFLPGERCNNDLYFRGLKFDIKPGGVKNLKTGQWHRFDIIVRGDEVRFLCNGEVQRIQKAKSKSSPLGIRAEFGAIQYRNLRVSQSGS